MRSRGKFQQKKVNSRVLILCEGETEELYFLEIKNSLSRDTQKGLQINISRSKNRDPLNIVKEAIIKKKAAKNEGAPYSTVWVVFDHDNFPKRKEAFAKAISNDIKLAYSSISIEVWFIFHYEYRVRSFTNGVEVKKYFKDNYMPNYRPGTSRVYEQIQSLTKTAIDNAVKIRDHHIDDVLSGKHISDLNPYITIDELVEYLKGL
ncbi:RloB family protein [Pontibacter akesuensis]|uniref:RloB-like protein n=1 Tax=Pontibacter akesuensis TaxID=388950 RepID=A0A1I7JNK9_9BACT|nr:RloB family protein [Pontibacter akesuensis]GHA68656.1 hypothetical protein GCM10007389_22070 [Pontibacter akesuensis]SFU86764.1 RloB-like protein [Pontibacter akesuensis]